ncbi:MAG: zf-HC2 domain-containing protein [Candidatus Hydrogenedentes bacterium]|nr:zf-HC2 domain-containing protein [Candidatus Hydrogenedentota bacterium]
MGCDLVRVSAYLDGELSETERRTFETHVQGCSECEEELQRLRRVVAMSIAYVPPMDLHVRVMSRIRQEDASSRSISWRRYRRVALVAAAVAVLVVGLGFWWMRGPNPATSLPMVVHAPDSELNRDGGTPAPKESQRREVAQDTSQQEKFAETTALPFRLVGTVAGGTPQAILVSTETNKQAVVGIGTQIAPGVVVKEIRQGEVVLDDNGTEVTLTKSATLTTAGPNLAGVWKVQVSRDGEKTDEFELVASVSGTAIEMRSTDNPKEPPISGTLAGLKFKLARVTEDEALVVEGTATEDGQHLTATAVTSDPRGQGEQVTYEVKGDKLDSKTVLAAVERKMRMGEVNEELRSLYPPFRAYAEANDLAMPNAPADLAPDYAADVSGYASTPDRRVTYHAGLSLVDTSIHKEPSYSGTLDEVAGQMIAHEQKLRQLYGNDIPVAPVLLEVAYPQEKLIGTVTVNGIVSVVDESNAEPSSRGPIAAQRASDQNNLKQLGLVVKMYQNEHKYECTPPGWLSVYPEYLTDPNVLTSPWDQPGTASYDYFFPARSQKELLQVAAEVSGDPRLVGIDLSNVENPATIAKLQSEVPLAANKHDIPGEAEARRNVLFLDGHVECVTMDQWEERVAPFIGR